jgi:hypothetical protein
VLAEALLAKLERALVRRGLAADRYSDDFRFTSASWSEVIRALEVLEEEARLVGLTVAAEAEPDLTEFDTDAYSGWCTLAITGLALATSAVGHDHPPSSRPEHVPDSGQNALDKPLGPPAAYSRRYALLCPAQGAEDSQALSGLESCPNRCITLLL